MNEQIEIYGKDMFGESIKQPKRSTLHDRFTVPPFSILNTRDGYWQKRKRAWISQGIKSELGRDIEVFNIGDKATFDEGLLYKSKQISQFDHYRVKEGTRANIDSAGTSIFDPVLTEIMYDWFCPANGIILDPFAGGSVRGIVASMLGRKYVGIDLSERQLKANRKQAADILSNPPYPEWKSGDAIDIDKLSELSRCNFVFSCPPYHNLEVYSDDKRDLSNMPYSSFIDKYRQIIKKCAIVLQSNSFACFVVGEIRDKKGHYKGFVPDTIRAFEDAGMSYYNEIILVNAIGSLPIRVTKQFNSGRKIGKSHQNVLVFVKGDSKLAASKIIS